MGRTRVLAVCQCCKQTHPVCTVLVLFNLDKEPVSDYHLSNPEFPEIENIKTKLIFGQGDVLSPETLETSGFSGYTPLGELAPESCNIILMEK